MSITKQLHQTGKSSYGTCSIKKKKLFLFVKILHNSQENTFGEVTFKALKIYYNRTPTQFFCCEYCKIFLKTYFEEHLHTAVSEVTLESDCLGLSFWTVAFKTVLSC